MPQDPHGPPPILPLHPPEPKKQAAHTLYMNTQGTLIPDPFEVLGLEGKDAYTTEEIYKAWAEEIALHPPEKDPEGARQLQEARDRLLSPEQLLPRNLGILYPPNPDAWNLPEAKAQDNSTASKFLDAPSRLRGQTMLYALVEDALLAKD